MVQLLQALAVFGAFILVVGGAIVWLTLWEKQARVTWKLVAEGELDRLECKAAWHRNRRGTTGHLPQYQRVHITIVYFADGSMKYISGLFKTDLPKGTKIFIYKNGLAEYRITDKADA